MYERDYRDMRGMDGRNPYGSRGGYVPPHRPRRGDRGMDMRGADYGDYARGGRGRTRGGRGARGDYRSDEPRRYDMASHPYGYGVPQSGDVRYQDMRGGEMRRDYAMDGHHAGRGGYEPVEFMGYCSGYYGSPDRGDYRDERDYGYYQDYGDYGETLSDEEIERWAHKLMSQLDEREKQMFNKDSIVQKAKQMGKQMDGFGEKEMWVATLMVYTDYKQTIGQNPDMAVKLAYDWLADKDVAVKGAEKLAVYYDCIVEGE